MKFLAVAALLVGAVMAVPTNSGSTYNACAIGLYSVAQCCATDVLGVADLNCQSPSEYPKDATDFRRICAKEGQRARCCVLPILGQAVLCNTPVGV